MGKALDVELQRLEKVVEQRISLLLNERSRRSQVYVSQTSNLVHVDTRDASSVKSLLQGFGKAKSIPTTPNSDVRSVKREDLGFVKSMLRRFSAFFRKL